MSSLRTKFRSSYRKEGTGNIVFVHTVTGNKADMEAFAAAQGSNLVIDEETGDTLYFSVDLADATGKLIITAKGNVAVDTSDFDRAAAKVKAAGGDLGQEIAKIAAQQLMGYSAPAPAAPVVAAPAVASEVNDDVEGS